MGYADGLFGPMTRSGITAWQEDAGFEATGFLTGAQVASLTTEQLAALITHFRF